MNIKHENQSIEHLNEKEDVYHSILSFLQEEFARKEFPQDLWLRLEEQYGDHIHQEILFALTRVKFEPEDARTHWRNILAHQKLLRETMNRDMGLRVALADYFFNIQPKINNPIIIEVNLFLEKEELALRDELTGLYNRRFFNHMLQGELERAARFGMPLSLLIIDVDDFKKFNDTYGHLVGDQALVELAAVLSQGCRTMDHLVRYGGEEFTIVLPGSDEGQSLDVAERHRKAVEEHCFIDRNKLPLTVSIGAATYPTDALAGLQLLEKADQALYRAKREGRNKAYTYSLDRRNDLRFPVTQSIGSCKLKSDYGLVNFRVDNISYGGFWGHAQESVQPGQKLVLKLPKRDADFELNLSGHCIRVEKDPKDERACYVGVRFNVGPDEVRSLLQHLINRKKISNSNPT